MPDTPTPWRPTPAPPTPEFEPWLGVAIAVGTDLAAAGLVWLWGLLPHRDPYFGILLLVLVCNIPFGQWIWIGPIYAYLRKGHQVRAKAMLVSASAITLLWATCWGVVVVFK